MGGQHTKGGALYLDAEAVATLVDHIHVHTARCGGAVIIQASLGEGQRPSLLVVDTPATWTTATPCEV